MGILMRVMFGSFACGIFLIIPTILNFFIFKNNDKIRKKVANILRIIYCICFIGTIVPALILMFYQAFYWAFLI